MTTLTGIRAKARFGDAQEAVNPTAVERSHEKTYEQRGKESYIWGALRFGMGWIFMWSFLDKLFGLGFPTSPESAWIAGGSPTFGFLNFGTSGPLADFYQGMAGNVVADTLYMIGMLAIGLPLLLGVGVRVAASIGVVMMGLIYTAGFLPPEHNPFMDQHIIFALVLLGLAMTRMDSRLGLGRVWSNSGLVKRFPFLS